MVARVCGGRDHQVALGKFWREYLALSNQVPRSMLIDVGAQLCICAIPVFFKIPGVHSLDLGTRTQGFVTNRRLLLSASGES